MFEDEAKFQQYLEKKSKQNAKVYYLRYRFSGQIIVENQKIDNMRYYVFNRKYCKKTVFYYHGGSYIDKPNLFHYRFIEKLLLNKEICVVFPIYPRLPDNNVKVCHSKIEQLYMDFISKNKVDKVVFMGDSAGGGLALHMSQYAKVNSDYLKLSKQKLILLSPWIDMAVDNPQINDIEKSDYQLSRVGLQKLGKLWADGDVKNPLASPLFGDMDCGDVTIVTGTREILYPDNLLLKQKMENIGKTINFYEFDNMAHCFMLMPIPEADKAFKKIIKQV